MTTPVETPPDINRAPTFSHGYTLVIAASTPTFDPIILQQWRDEGFKVHYEYVKGTSRSSTFAVQSFGDSLEDGEQYAIVAYGHAASLLLVEAFDVLPKLCAMVAFYPDQLPDPNAVAPKELQLQVHLAGTQLFAPRYRSFTYPGTSPGFDTRDSGTFDSIASGLAWSRALAAVRKGFHLEADLEGIWENHLAYEFITKDAAATLSTMTTNPSVVHVPTLTGGVGQRDLLRFYREFFIPMNPPSISTTLLSRTVGSDKIVDEMLISMTHSCEVPWLLPGVPATNKRIEFVLVSLVTIRGGKLQSERLHWDQASVLVQAGLLDARLGAVGLGVGGVNRLPIVGVEGSKLVVEGVTSGLVCNGLIPHW